MAVSYKPQKISPKFQGTVRQLLHTKIRDSYIHPQFVTDVLKPLQVDSIMDQEVLNLSGGELQRVAITLCLGQVTFLSSPLPPPHIRRSTWYTGILSVLSISKAFHSPPSACRRLSC